MEQTHLPGEQSDPVLEQTDPPGALSQREQTPGALLRGNKLISQEVSSYHTLCTAHLRCVNGRGSLLTSPPPTTQPPTTQPPIHRLLKRYLKVTSLPSTLELTQHFSSYALASMHSLLVMSHDFVLMSHDIAIGGRCVIYSGVIRSSILLLGRSPESNSRVSWSPVLHAVVTSRARGVLGSLYWRGRAWAGDRPSSCWLGCGLSLEWEGFVAILSPASPQRETKKGLGTWVKS